MWTSKGGETKGFFPKWMRSYLGPLLLIAVTIPGIIGIWHVNHDFEGSWLAFFKKMFENDITGVPSYVYSVWPTPFDLGAWKIILSYMAFELALMRLVPGKEFRATITPQGNQPIYKANGMQCFIISIVAFLALAHFEIIEASVIYYKMGHLLSSMNLFSLFFCLMLYLKGIYAPSTTDTGTSGNPVLDYWGGVELYPRILGFDVKEFTNCRFGMMFWSIGLLSYAAAQMEKNEGKLSNSMFLSVSLQILYCARFFWWETGYFNSMDIQHDKAGYYLCWGCLCYVPSMYTSQAYYLVNHPVNLSYPVAAGIFVLGVLCNWIVYDVDRQRQYFRATGGKCLIWGKKPVVLHASYETELGEERKSVLLASGWWGLSRHVGYVFEIMASFFWSCPGGFNHFMPFFYTFYLTILLLDRAYRDDARCRAKYEQYWEKYCELVPYKIIPGVL